MRAVPLARSRSQVSASWSMRCSAPPAAPRWTRACRSRTGASPRPGRCSSPTRNARNSNSTGSCRSAGAAIGCGLGGGISSTSTRRACSSSIVMRNQRGAAARATLRPRQPTPCSVTLPPPPTLAGRCSVICCASKSPSSRPFGALSSIPGSADSSQALPRSLPTAHHTVAASAATTNTATATTPMSTAHPRDRVRGRGTGTGTGAAMFGAGAAAGGIGGASIRTRCRC